MPEIAEHEPPSLAILAHYQEAGRAWVVAEPTGGPVGCLLARPVDGDLHIEQVSVHPRFARRGLGRRLIEHTGEVSRHARADPHHVPRRALERPLLRSLRVPRPRTQNLSVDQGER